MFGPKKTNAKEADVDPGIEDMMHLAKMQRMRARLPPPEDVIGAITRFVKYKATGEQGMSDTHAELLLGALKCHHDSQDRVHDGGSGKGGPFKLDLLEDINAVLARSSKRPAKAHLELVQYVLEQTRSGTALHRKLYSIYVRMLAFSGRASDARKITLETEQRVCSIPENNGSPEKPASIPEPWHKTIPVMWTDTLAGYAVDEDETELLNTLRMIEEREWSDPRRAPIAVAMLDFYLRRAQLDPIKSWFDEFCRAVDSRLSQPKFAQRMASQLHRVLKWCLQHDELDYGHEAVRRAINDDPSKGVWDAIFVWAAGTGKGADEIGRMFDVMEKTNESNPKREEWKLPDITTINHLVEYATSKVDPYLAERFIALGKSRGIEPDARTYQLQMDYRLKINDVDGALVAYKSLQAMDTSSNDDLPTINRLIVALCKGRRHDFDTIMNVAMDLSDRRARFEAATVSTLAILHLTRDEVHDVIDLLNTHAYHYSSTERDGIRDAILAFCLNPETPTSRSWDAYMTIRAIFEDTPRQQRTEIMKNFFARERPDMAVSLFTEMRRHSRPDTIPNAETYVASFLGSAKLRHLDSLEVIHNQLKLDYNINVNTYLNNALMIAYTACGQPRKAMTFWADIVASKEGPTFNSIHIMLRACEAAPLGDLQAKKVWDRLRRNKVDLDQSMWASYVAALAGNGDNETAINTVEEAEAGGELEVDAFLLGSLLDGAANRLKQEEIEEWAKEKWPEVWHDLERLGFDVDEQDDRVKFKIDRSVTP